MKFSLSLALILFAFSINVFSQNAAKAVEAYNRGLELQNAGDADNAFVAYTAAIAANPRMADAYNNRANIRQLRGDRDGAIADLSKVVEIAPTHGLSYYNRGNIYLEKGDYDPAIVDFSKAIENFNGVTQSYDKMAHAMSHINRGNALAAKGEYQKAIPDYTRALEIMPRSYEAFTGRGAAKHQLNDFAGAVADYTKALEIMPDNILILMNRAGAYTDMDPAAAMADFTRVTQLDPKHAEAYALRATILLSKGRKTEALADLQKAVQIKPEIKGEYQKYIAEASKK